MILQALVHCYEALAERGELEKPGWSPVKVSWGLELDADGQVKSLLAMGGTDAKGKQIPRTMKLPDPVKRSAAWRRIFCAIIPPMCWALTQKGSRNERANALRRARGSTGHLEGCASPNG